MGLYLKGHPIPLSGRVPRCSASSSGNTARRANQLSLVGGSELLVALALEYLIRYD